MLLQPPLARGSLAGRPAGTATCPQGAKNGATLTKQDATTTDLEKAFYAERQGRGFYDLDETICDATFAATSEALGEHIANRGR